MSEDSNEFDDFFDENAFEYNIRDYIIFLIEGNKDMHENGYFKQCLEVCD